MQKYEFPKMCHYGFNLMVWFKKINENFTKFIIPQKSNAELGKLSTLCMHMLRVCMTGDMA